jgi:hypothetical protein
VIPAIKRLYDYFEYLPKKKLYSIALGLTLLCLIVGIGVGQIPSLFAPKKEAVIEVNKDVNAQASDLTEKYGKIVYVSPENYPEEQISYKLIDDKTRKDMVLLKAADQKLKFAEGTTAKLLGKMQKTKNGEDVLFVEKIVFN